MDPWEHRGGLVVQEGRVDLDLHVDLDPRVGHPLASQVPESPPTVSKQACKNFFKTNFFKRTI